MLVRTTRSPTSVDHLVVLVAFLLLYARLGDFDPENPSYRTRTLVKPILQVGSFACQCSKGEADVPLTGWVSRQLRQ